MMQDFWKTAANNQLIPSHEWLLQGSVLNQHREALKHRLQGLCDNSETGSEQFDDHEMVYTLRGVDQSFKLNVRHALHHNDRPWHVRYVGNDMNKTPDIPVRSYIEAAVSDNITKFLADMGFRFDYEFVARGFLYKRGKMKVTISTIFKLIQPGNTQDNNLEQVSASHLVELSVLTSVAENVEQDIKNFAEQLKPLVTLEKVDYRHLVS